MISATFTYSATLIDNTLGHSLPGEDAILAALSVTATDSDGSSDSASLDVQIIDDVPDAADDSATQTTENLSFTIDALDNDVLGADGVATIDTTQVFVSTQATQGVVTYNPATGLFTYTPNPGAGSSSTTDSFSYTIVDNDGDVSTATVTITLQPDSTPVASPVIAAVDDDGLPLGNAFNADDIDADIGDLNAGEVGDTEAIFVGQLSGNFGNDGPGTYSFASGPAMLGTEPVTLTWDSDTSTLTATSARGPVFTIVVDQMTGQYTLTLLQNVLHSGGDNGEVAEALALTYFAIDSEGDVSPGSTLTVTFGDDAPSDFSPESNIIQDGGSLGGTVPDSTVTGTLGIIVGADAPGVLSFSIADGTPVIDGNTGSPVTVGGDALRFYIDPNTGNLVATTGNSFNTGTIGFTVTLDETGTGSYQFNIFEDLSNGTTTTFDSLESTNAGNANYRGIGADDPATLVDVLLSGTAAGVSATVNTDSNSIGVANQSMDAPGEYLRMDFVSNLTSDAASPTGFAYTGRETTQSFEQFVPQVQGSQAEVVSLRVYAIASAVTQAAAPDSNPVNGLAAGETIEQITMITVTNYLTGQTSDAFDVTTLAVNVSTAVAFGISVTRNADGSVTFSGLQEGDSYSIATATDFSAVIVQAVSGSFDLGIFSIGSFNAGEDIELSFGVTVTDADGDTANGTINVNVDQDGSSLMAPAAMELNALVSEDKIASLTSEEIAAANDDGSIYGTGGFTINGANGVLADAAYAIGGIVAANDGMAAARAEQRLSLVAMNHAALAGLLVGLPVAAAAHSDLGQFVNARVANDFSGPDFSESLSLPTRAGLAGFEGAMLLGENAAPRAWADLAASRSISDAGAQLQHNPLEFAGEVSGAPSAPAWAAEEFSPAAPVFFNGSQAGDPGLMEALLLGGDNVALPAAVDLVSGDQAPVDMMDALLLIGGDNAAMPAFVDLASSGLAQQTVVDALAGNLVDHLIDQVVGGSDMAGPAPIAAKPEFLIDMLSFDLTGSAQVSGSFQDSAPLDDAAQLALING